MAGAAEVEVDTEVRLTEQWVCQLHQRPHV